MRRIALKTGPAALFGAIMLVALIVFLPMRLVVGAAGLDDIGVTARAATGSVWSGQLQEARFGDVALGDLDVHLSPLALLIGRARIAVRSERVPPLAGTLALSRHLRGVDDLTASLPAGGVFAPVPVTTLDLDDVTIRFSGDVCETAEGRVKASIAGEVEGVALPASVSGNARCDGGALVIPLASQPGTETITLRVTGSGRYTAVLTLAQPDPAAAQRLALAGFVQGPQGYRLSIQGRF